MADLEILDLAGLRAFLLVLGITVVEAQIVVVGSDRAEYVVPDDLDGDVGIVGVNQREGLAGDEADDGLWSCERRTCEEYFSVASL